jgi:NTP pyrophosphatase (non-canonical NTP hydrolase)
MQLNEYQTKALQYRLPTADRLYVLLNTVGEIGEFYGKVSKSFRDNTELNQEDLKKELGDCMWMLSALCFDMGFSLEDVCSTNLEKLESRRLRNAIMGSGDNR